MITVHRSRFKTIQVQSIAALSYFRASELLFSVSHYWQTGRREFLFGLQRLHIKEPRELRLMGHNAIQALEIQLVLNWLKQWLPRFDVRPTPSAPSSAPLVLFQTRSRVFIANWV